MREEMNVEYRDFLAALCSDSDFDSEKFKPFFTASRKKYIRLSGITYERAENSQVELDVGFREILKKEIREEKFRNLALQKQVKYLDENTSSTLILLKNSAFDHFHGSHYRSSNDLDVLVRVEQANSVKSDLQDKMEYFNCGGGGIFTDLYEISFKPKNNYGYSLDLHFNFVHPYLFDINLNKVFSKAINHKFYSSNKVKVMCLEHNVLHLAIHSFKDGDFYSYGLVDLRKITENNDIDWDFLIEESKEWGTEYVLFYFLQAAKVAINYEIEEQILEKLKPNFFRRCMIILTIKMQFSTSSKIKRLGKLVSFYSYSRSLFGPTKLCLKYLQKKLKK